jgi:predicted outer membrane repeat protein
MLNKGISYKSAAYCLVVLVFSNLALANKIIYVDDDANGVNDGSSWQNAYVYLQNALKDAKNSQKPVEIRVAQGIYKPDQGLNIPIKQSASFLLINGVIIKGGYAGINEHDPNDRSVDAYKSILSGDLYGNDIAVEDSSELLNQTTKSDNSTNVVTSSGNDANAVLEGFTIRGGYNMAWADPGPSGGAGMNIYYHSKATVIKCTFTYNAARECGGGILIIDSNPTIIECIFTKNFASSGAGIFTGTTFGTTHSSNPQSSNPIILKCVFNNNYSVAVGAGIYNYKGIPKLSNCIFKSNISGLTGAGINGDDNMELETCSFIQNTAGSGGAIATRANITLKYCIFIENKALGTRYYSEGGGACYLSGENSTITNCTFSGNWAKQNGAIYKTSSSILNISNSILWNEENKISDSNSSTLIVRYSDIQGCLEGEGNINTDPLFANPGYWADANDPSIIAEPNDPNSIWIDGDYHLKSQAGRFDPNSQTWVQDDVTSPCVDAGDPNSPIGLEPFPNGGYINMGAYGGTSEASKSYFGKPLCTTIVAGDINGDCKVDITDLEILMIHWLEEH